MVVTCEIKFLENPNGAYFDGQLLSGTVTLTCDKPKDVQGVLLKTSGHAVTGWSEKRFGKRRHYSGREDYLASLTYLLGSEENNKSTLQIGIHTYTFACQLPRNCPTSFEGLYGSIRYSVKVVLKRPWKFDQTYSCGFTVLKTVDLNFDTPQLKLPANTSAYKTFCCGACKTEPLQLQIHTPQSGYVPGETINVRVLVINNSNIPVAEMRYSLVMLVRYFSQNLPGHSRIERITVTKLRGDSVLRNCTREFTPQLQVPATPLTLLSHCKIIQIAYQIEVEASMQGWHGNQVITMPVTIGNVPLWHSAPTTAVVVQQPSGSNRLDLEIAANGVTKELTKTQQALNAVPTIATAPPATGIYPQLPPPSYQESLHTMRGDINEDELHAFGPCEFAPCYPVYNLSTEQFAAPQQRNGGYENRSFES